jgi:hypothetical protein
MKWKLLLILLAGCLMAGCNKPIHEVRAPAPPHAHPDSAMFHLSAMA